METANLGFCQLTVKYLVFIFNFFFFLCGLGLIIIGAVVQGFFSEYVEFFANKYETPAIGMIILGAIIMVIAFFGCCGAKTENVCMLNTFAGLLGIIVICEIAACITVAVLKSEVQNAVQENMINSQKKYGADDKEGGLVKAAWDNLQYEYDCCGTRNYTDWFNTNFGHVPDTCCLNAFPNCSIEITPDSSNAQDIIHTEGCFESLQQSAMKNLAAIAAGAVVLALVQIVGIWMACGLVKAVRERYEVL